MSRHSPPPVPSSVPHLSPSRPFVEGKVWTPPLVQTRLVEAFSVLRRTPARIGPKQYGVAWPQMLEIDEIDPGLIAAARIDIDAHNRLKAARAEIEGIRSAREQRQREEANRNATRPTPLPVETSMAEEALHWPMQYLREQPMQADALQLWAFCGAFDFNMARVLRERVERANALIAARGYDEGPEMEDRREEIRREEKHDERVAAALHERNEAVAPKVERRRSEEFEQLKASIVANSVAWATARLTGNSDPLRFETVKSNATIGAQRDLEAGVRKMKVRPSDVMPGKVFSRRWLDRCRHLGAQNIADALNRDNVEVR